MDLWKKLDYSAETNVIMELMERLHEKNTEMKLLEKDMEMKLHEKDMDIEQLNRNYSNWTWLKEKEMEMREKDMERELHEKIIKMQQLSEKDMEMQLIKKLYEKDMEFTKKLDEKDLKFEVLKNEYAQVNLEHLYKQKNLCVWSIFKLFKQKRLGSENAGEVQYREFAEKTDNLIEMEAWNFTPATFATAAECFYKRICQLAPSTFYSDDDTLAIAADLLTESEWRVLGLIWKLFPLPVGKLVKCNMDGSKTMIRELKDVSEKVI